MTDSDEVCYYLAPELWASLTNTITSSQMIEIAISAPTKDEVIHALKRAGQRLAHACHYLKESSSAERYKDIISILDYDIKVLKVLLQDLPETEEEIKTYQCTILLDYQGYLGYLYGQLWKLYYQQVSHP